MPFKFSKQFAPSTAPAGASGALSGMLSSAASKSDRAGQFLIAAEHSKRVKRAKVLLPAISGFILLVFVGIISFAPSFIPGLDLGDFSIEDGEVVMRNPNLRGFTSGNRAYEVRADRAIQKLEDPTKVRLENLSAKLEMKSGELVSIKAANGFFDTEKEQLKMSGGVTLETSKERRLEMETVDIDMAEGAMKSDQPISLSTPQADLEANRVELSGNGDLIVFKDRVKMIINPNAIKAQSAEPTNEQ